MLSPVEMSDRIQDVLKKNGFKFETMSSDHQECDAVYCRTRADTPIYVSVPINPKVITKAVVDNLSVRTGISRKAFRDALDGF